jgi:mRNA interferase HigB
MTVLYARHHSKTSERIHREISRYQAGSSPLVQHYKKGSFSNFAELRAVFPTADQVGKLTVFNIGGTKVRLIAAIHYNRKKVYIRAVLTHAEYDEGRWRE